MKINLSLLAIFFTISFIQPIFAQEPDTLWSKIYGGDYSDEGYEIQKTINNGFVAVGYTRSFGNGSTDVWLVKTNSKGEKVWAKTFGEKYSEKGYSVKQTSDKGFVVAGYTSSSNDTEDYNYYLIKTDSLGDTSWTRQYGSNKRDEAYSVQQTLDGGYILTGSSVMESTDMLTIKTDQNGNILWSINYGGKFNDIGRSVIELKDGNYIITGYTTTETDTINHAYLMKVSKNGNIIWTRIYGTQNPTSGKYVSQTLDGGFIIGGQNNYNAWLLKTDSLGNTIWSEMYTGSTTRNINCVKQTKDNGYICTMWINDGGSGNYSKVIKTDSLGIALWEKTYYSSQLKVLRSVVLTNDGGYVFTGVNDDGYHRIDLWILKLGNREVIANFSADTLSGKLPFTVIFNDSSSINTVNWNWYFENDGIIDSYEKNPTWTYFDADTYSVKLIVSNELDSDTLLKENYIITYFDTIPHLYSINDISNDQGGWVKVNFARSVFDTDTLVLSKASSAELYTVEINDGSGWMSTTSTVAYGNSAYSVLVPTTKDSIVGSNGLIDFRVIAGMDEGNYVSNIMSGYSVDNLRPSIPQHLEGNITQESYVKLRWVPASEKDFNYYKIFRSTDGTSFELIDTTIDTVHIDNNVTVDNSYHYSIKAVDHSGNESDYSNIVNIIVTALTAQSSIPVQYYLLQNYPNPFNPLTTIKYGLLKQCNVRIVLYDILGHKIKELINETQNSGHHQVIWNGTNNSGRVVSTGIYYYKIETETFNSVRKMIFVR